MNRRSIHDMKKIGQIVYLAAIGAAGTLLADEWFYFCWPKPAAALSVLVFTAFICWSRERTVKPYLWAGIALAFLSLPAVVHKSGRDMEPYLLFLGMEAACAFAAFLSCLAEKRFFLRTALILAETVCLICYGIDGMELPKWTVCMVLFAFLMLLTEAVEWKSERKGGLNAVQLVPVFCCVILAISLLPVPEKPMQWTAVKKVLSLAKEQMTAVIAEVQFRFQENGGSFSLNFSGYDEDGGLGGSVFSSDQAQLSIKGDQTKSPFYAGGTMFDTYTGNGWTQSEKPGADQEEYRLQYEGWKNAFRHSVFSEQDYRELTHMRSCSIRYDGVKTKSLFLAPVTEKLTMPDGEKTIGRSGGGLTLKKAEGVGFCYTMRFLEIDYQNEKIKQLLRQQAWSGTPVLDEKAKKRQDEIYACYTALPDSLPERITELAHEITEGAETDYDRMKAIEAYLHGYTYAVSVKKCPKGTDPVDYFLFESRTGYCTYFAAAAALLGRCEGIPTRYVEGFLTSETMEPGGEEIRMTGNNVHAWTEAYIKNIGWVPLEPTPGYGNSSAEAWEQPKAGAGTVTGEVSLEGKPKQDGTDQVMEGSAEKAPDLGKQIRKGAAACLKILLLAGLLAGTVTVFILLRNYMRRRSYRSKNETDKLREQMRQALYFGKLCGEEMKSGETLEAYGRRCCRRLDTPDISFAGFCTLFEAVRFGGGTVDQEILDTAEKYVKTLERQYLDKAGRWKRFLYYLR